MEEQKKIIKIFESKLGSLIQGNSIELLKSKKYLNKLKGKVNLIVTSPLSPLTIRSNMAMKREMNT